MPFFLFFISYFILCLIIDVHYPIIRILLFPALALMINTRKPLLTYWSYANKEKIAKVLLVLVCLLSVGRIAHVTYKLRKPIKHIEDMAILNRDAVNLLLDKGGNPYKENINPYVVEKKDGSRKNYGGYKYPPLPIFFYAPFVKMFDLKGIYVGNIIIYLSLLFALVYFATGLIQKYLAVIFYLGTDYFFTLAFNNGTNDFLPVLFLYLFVASLNKTKWAWVFHSLSILTKQLPGGILVFFWPKKKKEFLDILKSLCMATVVCIPFLIWDFKSFFENTVEFAISRPVRETSMFWKFPSWTHALITPMILLFSLITRKFREKITAEGTEFLFIILLLLIFLVPAKMAPTHYFVWLTPFLVHFYANFIPEKLKA